MAIRFRNTGYRAIASRRVERIQVDRLKLTVIAHRELEFCNPVSSERVDRVIALLDLPPGARVFDAGWDEESREDSLAGSHQERSRGAGRAPRHEESPDDLHARTLRRRRQSGAARSGSLVLHEMEAAQFLAGEAPFDAALCVGSTH